jgi:hypothetical protein
MHADVLLLLPSIIRAPADAIDTAARKRKWLWRGGRCMVQKFRLSIEEDKKGVTPA